MKKAAILSAFLLSLILGSTALLSQTNFEFVLSDDEVVLIPNENPWGLVHTPDGPISYRYIDNELRMWFTVSRWTTLMRGSNFDDLLPYPLDAFGRAVTVLGPSDSGFDSTYAGAYAVIPAYNGNDLLMIYHAENHPCPTNYAPVKYAIGLARSSDNGLTWQRRGQILSTYGTPPPDNCNFNDWGLGNPTVYRSPDGQYLYMLFGEWLRGNPIWRPDGIYLARAPIESDGEPGTWQKYANGSFSQSGLGGLGTLVIAPPAGTNPNYAAQPSVSFNVYLNAYILVFQSRLGLHIAISEDGVNWDTPRLAWDVPDFYLCTLNNVPGVAYFTLISPDQPSQMTTGRTGYLYFARLSPNGNPPHIMSRRSFEIKMISSVKSSKTDFPSEFRLYQNVPNPFNPATSIRYSVSQAGLVSISLLDLLGREILTLVNESKNPGTYEVLLYGSALPSGVYFYKMSAGDFAQTEKLLLLR